MPKISTVILPKLAGLLVVTCLALLSYAIVALPFMTKSGISSLVIAIVLGIMFGNLYKQPASWSAGIQFSAKRLLRTAIILYGFRVTFQQIASVGLEALFIDIAVVSLTLSVGYIIGRRVFKLDHDLSILISAGAAICGAAAVLAVEDILKSEPYKTSIAIATVVIFGTLSMFIYPAFQHAGILGLSANQFGIFAGASIHEVAQALVAGSEINSQVGQIAVIVKMIRVLMLVPVLLTLAYLSARKNKGQQSHIIMPWFAFIFVAVIGFNSLHVLSPSLVNTINQIDIILLTMAMGAIGMETKLSKMKQVGVTPFYLALGLTTWLFVGVLNVVKVFT